MAKSSLHRVEPDQFSQGSWQKKSPSPNTFTLSISHLILFYLLRICLPFICSPPPLFVFLASFLLLLNIHFFSIPKQAMADAVLSALVTTIMGNLNPSFLRELGLAGSLETERENLNRTIRTIRAVLQDAEEKQWTSEAIKVWLRDLKDAAYDADDLLSDFANEAQRHQQRRDLKNRVRSFFSINYNPLVFRRRMVHKLKSVREKLDAIAMERQKFHLREGAVEMEASSFAWRQTGSLVNESGIYGRRKEKEDLINMLLTKDMRRMQSLVYVDITYCFSLRFMPIGMGELTCLRKLGIFVVGKEDGRGIEELGRLNNLAGELSITDLDNVKNSSDARSANLNLKTALLSLTLSMEFEWKLQFTFGGNQLPNNVAFGGR
uniref:Uncharacterized protein n=1 Tax=Populus alba TaxID=43335 RepID=A0A4U5PVR2_POPAL|nr:hypothetical protein D5086_0000178380 [Populus alba]